MFMFVCADDILVTGKSSALKLGYCTAVMFYFILNSFFL